MKGVLKFLWIAVIVAGCKPGLIPFDETKLDPSYIRKMIVTAKGFEINGLTDSLNNKVEKEDTVFSRMRIYEATLVDRYVVRDGILEETVVNAKASTETSDLLKISNTYRIFMVMTNNKPSSGAAILIPTIFNANGKCIGLGPAQLGKWGAKQFAFNKELRWNAKRFKWEYSSKENEFKRTRSIYFDAILRDATKREVVVVINIKNRIIELDEFDVDRIYNAAENKFGGHKPVLFVIKDIFGDPHALHFKILKDL